MAENWNQIVPYMPHHSAIPCFYVLLCPRLFRCGVYYEAEPLPATASISYRPEEGSELAGTGHDRTHNAGARPPIRRCPGFPSARAAGAGTAPPVRGGGVASPGGAAAPPRASRPSAQAPLSGSGAGRGGRWRRWRRSSTPWRSTWRSSWRTSGSSASSSATSSPAARRGSIRNCEGPLSGAGRAGLRGLFPFQARGGASGLSRSLPGYRWPRSHPQGQRSDPETAKPDPFSSQQEFHGDGLAGYRQMPTAASRYQRALGGF